MHELEPVTFGLTNSKLSAQGTQPLSMLWQRQRASLQVIRGEAEVVRNAIMQLAKQEQLTYSNNQWVFQEKSIAVDKIFVEDPWNRWTKGDLEAANDGEDRAQIKLEKN